MDLACGNFSDFAIICSINLKVFEKLILAGTIFSENGAVRLFR